METFCVYSHVSSFPLRPPGGNVSQCITILRQRKHPRGEGKCLRYINRGYFLTGWLFISRRALSLSYVSSAGVKLKEEPAIIKILLKVAKNLLPYIIFITWWSRSRLPWLSPDNGHIAGRNQSRSQSHKHTIHSPPANPNWQLLTSKGFSLLQSACSGFRTSAAGLSLPRK